MIHQQMIARSADNKKRQHTGPRLLLVVDGRSSRHRNSRPVHPLPYLRPHREPHPRLRRYNDLIAGPRIPTDPSLRHDDVEDAEAAKFDAAARRQGLGDRVQHALNHSAGKGDLDVCFKGDAADDMSCFVIQGLAKAVLSILQAARRFLDEKGDGFRLGNSNAGSQGDDLDSTIMSGRYLRLRYHELRRSKNDPPFQDR